MVDDDGAPADRAAAELLAALVGLRGAVAEIRLPLDVPGAEAQRTARTQVLDQLDDYLLPRLRAASAPLLVVVGGSTGAGKSTLVNSLLGEPVSRSGVLRPTTRSPVLVHHPLDAHWFRGDRILPGMARLTAEGGQDAGTARALRLAASDALPPGLALLDAPDIDSVVAENRRIAAQLLGAADVWLFVTTAARYADAVPWDLLQDAARRHAQVALVLDRVDPGARAAVTADLESMLAEHGLADSPVLVVPESPLEDGMLPAHVVTPVADWLTALGGDEARQAAIARTREGVTTDLVARADALASAADEQRAADAHLRRVVRTAHDDAAAAVRKATSDGTMLRGEVLARWQDVVGTGEFLRAVEQRVGWLRDKISAAMSGRSAAEPELAQAIGHGLEAVIQDAAEDAAERSYTAWRADPAGSALLEGLALSRGGSDLRSRIAEQIRAWQSDVLALVTEEGASKRSTARALSFGVNGLGAALMVVVFASTGGLTGAEIGIAGGSALLAQRLLEAVFGDDAVRELTTIAHDRLDQRVRGVLAAQELRFTVQLDALGAAGESGDALRGAVGRVRTAATAAQGASGDDAAPVDPATGLVVAGAGAGGRGSATGRPAGRLRGAGLTAPVSVAKDTGASAWGSARRESADRDDEHPDDADRASGGLRGWWQRITRGPEA